jgi:hypothetical protein
MTARRSGEIWIAFFFKERRFPNRRCLFKSIQFSGRDAALRRPRKTTARIGRSRTLQDY